MRFKASIRNVNTFIKLAASLNSLGPVAWIRLDNDQLRCTVIPEQGSQVWAVLSLDTIFDDDYNIQSAAPSNTINLEVPLGPLHRALRSAQSASSASIRLTKKDNLPYLALTILANIAPTGSDHPGFEGRSFSYALDGVDSGNDSFANGVGTAANSEIGNAYNNGPSLPRETTITQDIPIRVLSAPLVEGIHEPRCRDPDVHILLPPLLQLKAISERFTKLSLSSSRRPNGAAGLQGGSGPRLEIAANMHGGLKIGIKTDTLKIESRWEGLGNPELDAERMEGGAEGVRAHPSTRMKAVQGEEGWAVVRVEGKDWGRVLGVGRLGGKVIACFCHDHALILYVYLPNDDAEDSVLTYYINSYSA